MQHQLILLTLYILKLADNATVACEINGNDQMNYKVYLRNGDVVKIITSKNKSPSLHWIRYYQNWKS